MLVVFTSDLLVVTITIGTTTTAMIKIITMMMNVLRNNFCFLVTSTLK
jgi:hypothetical protein